MLTNLKSFSVEYVLSQIIRAHCLCAEWQGGVRAQLCNSRLLNPESRPGIAAVDSGGALLECCNSCGGRGEAFSQGYYFHNHFNCTCPIHQSLRIHLHLFKGNAANSKILSNYCSSQFTQWKNKTLKWIIRFSEFLKENWHFAWRRNSKSLGPLVKQHKECPLNPGSNTLYRETSL